MDGKIKSRHFFSSSKKDQLEMVYILLKNYQDY